MRNKWKKQGISIMIGYVLLISFAIVMGVVAYQWMKSYVPAEDFKCVDDVSVFLTKINCTNQGTYFELDLTLKNNGLFNVAGYFIRGKNDSNPGQELAALDLSQSLTGEGEFGIKAENAVIFLGGDNGMVPNEERRSIFRLDNEIYSLEIIPVRYQEEEGKKRFITCGYAKIKEEVNC